MREKTKKQLIDSNEAKVGDTWARNLLGLQVFRASFYIHALISIIQAIWRQHKIIETCSKA